MHSILLYYILEEIAHIPHQFCQRMCVCARFNKQIEFNFSLRDCQSRRWSFKLQFIYWIYCEEQASLSIVCLISIPTKNTPQCRLICLTLRSRFVFFSHQICIIGWIFLLYLSVSVHCHCVCVWHVARMFVVEWIYEKWQWLYILREREKKHCQAENSLMYSPACMHRRNVI